MSGFDDYLFIRLACAFICGTLLSANGSLIQVVTQNPLAAPSTVGIQGAGLLLYLLSYGLSFFLGGETLLIAFTLFHFLFLVFFFIWKPSQELKFEGLKKIILWGLCLNLLVGALFSLLQFVLLNLGVQFPTEIWFGNFSFADKKSFLFLAFIFLVHLVLNFKMGSRLRLFVLGKSFSHAYVENEKYLIRSLFLFVFYTTTLITFFFGYFSFLGLIFPHMLRAFSSYRKDIFKEIYFGSLWGGLVFSLMDYFCYQFPIKGAELPLGMIMAVFGPLSFLILLLFRSRVIKNVY